MARRPKLGWWAPWQVTRPWLPRAWRGTDEWHNPAVSVVLPLLGAFHLWLDSWSDGTDGHYDPRDVPDCPVCQAIAADVDTPASWWLNPPRPA